MTAIRSITATQAKASLGEVLASLGDGPVQITRNGRPVASLSAVVTPRPIDSDRFVHLVKLYASGALSWREVAREAEVSFGEILVELGRQGLPLPITPAGLRSARLAALQAAFNSIAL